MLGCSSASALKPSRGKASKSSAAVTMPSRNQHLANMLAQDQTAYALCRGNQLQLEVMCNTAVTLLHKAYNLKTCRRDAAAFRKWVAYCRAINTTPWRDDAAANSGADSIGHRREIVLAINAMVHHQQTAKPRPNGTSGTLVKPDTALAWLMAIRRVFKANMIPLLPIAPIRNAVKALCNKFIAEFGQASLMPHRAAPFTNSMLDDMLNCSGVMDVTATKAIDWESWEGLHCRALLAVARLSGMRKSELVTHDGSMALCIGNTAFLIKGRISSRPSEEQLDSLSVGDFLVITPPPSKSDLFGVVWGSLPIYLSYMDERRNAVRLVAQIHRIRRGAPSSEPLFCPAPGKQFTHAFLDKMLQKWLQSVGLSTKMTALYSFHSARAHLACALAAAKRPPDVIQALLRWQSVDSLRVYVAFNPSDYAAHLAAAQTATVDGIRGVHVPITDSLKCN